MKMIKILMMLIVLIVLSSFAYSVTTISGCTNLSTIGETYELDTNIFDNTSASISCINITANNVTLDCKGYYINYSTGKAGNTVINLTSSNYTTIKNCIFKEENLTAVGGFISYTPNNIGKYLYLFNNTFDSKPTATNSVPIIENTLLTDFTLNYTSTLKKVKITQNSHSGSNIKIYDSTFNCSAATCLYTTGSNIQLFNSSFRGTANLPLRLGGSNNYAENTYVYSEAGQGIGIGQTNNNHSYVNLSLMGHNWLNPLTNTLYNVTIINLVEQRGNYSNLNYVWSATNKQQFYMYDYILLNITYVNGTPVNNADVNISTNKDYLNVSGADGLIETQTVLGYFINKTYNYTYNISIKADLGLFSNTSYYQMYELYNRTFRIILTEGGTSGSTLRVVFHNQTPSDLTSTNTINTETKIIYNITYNTTTESLNYTWLYFNVSTSDCWIIINGECFFNRYAKVNMTPIGSNQYEAELDDNMVYAGSYAHSRTFVESRNNTLYPLNTANTWIEQELMNISVSQFSFLEAMYNSTASGTGIGDIFMCNESGMSSPSTNTNCVSIATQTKSASWDHCHTLEPGNVCEKVWILPFNTTSRKLGNVYVPLNETLYFLFSGSGGSGGNFQMGISTHINRSQARITANNGGTWSNFTNGTAIIHVHSFNGSDSLNYYANISSNISTNVTAVRTDNYLITFLDPIAPFVYSPNETLYNSSTGNGTLWINYTQAIPMSVYAKIINYSLYYVKSDLTSTTFIYNFSYNNTNFTYLWDFNSVPEGYYYVMVRAMDNNSRYSDGYSSLFRIYSYINTSSTVKLEVNQCPDTIPGQMALWMFIFILVCMIFVSIIFKIKLLGIVTSLGFFPLSWIMVGCEPLMGYTVALIGVIIFSYFTLFRTQDIPH